MATSLPVAPSTAYLSLSVQRLRIFAPRRVDEPAGVAHAGAFDVTRFAADNMRVSYCERVSKEYVLVDGSDEVLEQEVLNMSVVGA